MSVLSRFLVISIICLTVTTAAFAQDEIDSGGENHGAEIDALFSKVVMKNGPGGVVMVIDNGRVVYKAGYGLSNIQAGTPITTKHMFHLGSIGKQFTAAGIMMLCQDGLLGYDDPIGKHIPELQRFGRDLTIRRLLNHTSGIADYDEDNGLQDALLDKAEKPRNADLIAVLAKTGTPLFNPGDDFKYSNTGYDVLGALIERISGKTYGQFMDERFFGKLGMSHTFALPNLAKVKDPLLCISYELEGSKTVPDLSHPLDNLNSSGSCYSTVEDLFLYDQALYTDTPVKQSTLAEAFKEVKLNNGSKSNYGFAFEMGSYQDEYCVSHGGSWLAFDNFYLRFPQEKLSVFVLLNHNYVKPDAEKTAHQIADMFLN
ncbi:MAG: serine hydrolase domain-containing protein [Vulcanimicrobiota bacterium]